VQVVIPKTARVDPSVREEIRSLVAHINSRYGTSTHTPVTYMEEKITFDMRMALYTICDALVLTPIRDGLNLIPYEYIVSTPEGKGQLILSEFTGCSRALSSAVRVNPWNSKELRDVIDNVVQKRESRPEEIARKHEADRKYVTLHSSVSWAESFLADLKESSEVVREVVRLGLSTGVGFRTLEFDGFTMLNTRAVVKAFRESKNRLFLLDYDGTLTTIGSDMQASMAHSWAVPATEVMDSLARLASQDNCNVVIVSGRKKSSAGFHQEVVAPLGIAAEHGFYYKAPNSTEFVELAPGADLSWIHIALRIMRMYTERTDGSYVEEKDAGLVWHYLNTDPEFGGWQAKEMHDHLESILSPFNVQVVSGHGWLQVRLANVNKGKMVEHVLAGMDEGTKPDFVLCCGDDRTDEDMFETLHKNDKTKDAALFTTTVGVKPSKARYYLRSAYEVQQLIDQLLEVSDPSSSTHVRSSTLDDLRPAAIQQLALLDAYDASGSPAGLASSSSLSGLDAALAGSNSPS
jgi:trehalose 6-phosphate synthase/phosphatase